MPSPTNFDEHLNLTTAVSVLRVPAWLSVSSTGDSILLRVITDDDLHASLACVRTIGSPIPDAASAPPRNADSAPGSGTAIPTDSGARSFNLDACMRMGEGQ
jgi:hypothetical protein